MFDLNNKLYNTLESTVDRTLKMPKHGKLGKNKTNKQRGSKPKKTNIVKPNKRPAHWSKNLTFPVCQRKRRFTGQAQNRGWQDRKSIGRAWSSVTTTTGLRWNNYRRPWTEWSLDWLLGYGYQPLKQMNPEPLVCLAHLNHFLYPPVIKHGVRENGP